MILEDKALILLGSYINCKKTCPPPLIIYSNQQYVNNNTINHPVQGVIQVNYEELIYINELHFTCF